MYLLKKKTLWSTGSKIFMFEYLPGYFYTDSSVLHIIWFDCTQFKPEQLYICPNSGFSNGMLLIH